ncbi:MAG: hypothetical protein IJE81_00835 [Oscillospiraceae bacterium]|nr:hypothetical protein [Oscillospiraceae bacterium]
MKKLNHILNIIMGAALGAFAGRGLYIVWNFKTHPELYAIQSAPWYTSILADGVFVFAVLLICIVIKVILRNNGKDSG